MIYLQGDVADKLFITLGGRVALHMERPAVVPGNADGEAELARLWAAESEATPAAAAARVRRLKNKRTGISEVQRAAVPGGASAADIYGPQTGLVEEGDAFGHWELLQVCGARCATLSGVLTVASTRCRLVRAGEACPCEDLVLSAR